jgi:ATP-dependent Clp protease ATP-binding subunit ClpC
MAQDFHPSVGVEIGKHWYAWDERIDDAAFAIKRATSRASLWVNVVSLALTVLLALAFVASAFVFGDPADAFNPYAWFTPSLSGYLFFLALLAACFTFYRLAEANRRKVLVPKREKDEAEPVVAPLPPGIDARNVADVFASDALKAIEEGYRLAEKYGHAELSPLHLFIGGLSSGESSVTFARLGVSFDAIKESLARRLEMQQVGKPLALSRGGEECLVSAFVNAHAQGRASVSALEVFAEAYRHDAFLKELLFDQMVEERQFLNVIEWIRMNAELRERYAQFRRAAAFKPTGAMNRAMTAVATPTLDAFSEDLTAAGVRGALPLVVGRDKEIEAVFRVIEGGRKSVLLVGPDGTGRHSIVQAIAELMVEERVPKLLEDKRLVSVSLPHLLAGSPEEAKERLMALLVEAARARNVVLAFTHLDLIADHEAAPLLADALQRGVAYAIATADPATFANVIERTPLGRAFEKVDVGEPSPDDAILILESKVGSIEYEHRVSFTYDAIEKAVKLTDRYVHETYLPAKAIEACREAAQDAAKSRGADATVTGEDVARVIAQKSGVPLQGVTRDETNVLLTLEEKMHGRVIGQDEAVKAVSSALRRARTELRSQARPIATLLFLGPTGVGKTELAKTVAETYFGAEDAMLRFDMSEYQDAGSVGRLIGSGSSFGQLTEAVRRKPFAIVLLDEFEKAHPDILNLFLQVFDDGRLTDASGRTVDFTSCIIIATSNAGTPYIQSATAVGTPLADMKTHLIETELRSAYRPELLNRFDSIIVFKPLSPDDVLQIAHLLVGKVAERLQPKGIGFRATDEAVAELAQKGYDPQFGARPLRRVIQEEVDNTLANALLEGKVRRRDTIVLQAGGKIDVQRAPEL